MEYERLTPGYVAAVAEIRRGRLVTPQSVASPGPEYIGITLLKHFLFGWVSCVLFLYWIIFAL